MTDYFQVGDVVRWQCPKFSNVIHDWVIRGVHLGGKSPQGVWTESVIEIENVSHVPASTGEWETHQLMFVPEVLLRGLPVVRKGYRFAS